MTRRWQGDESESVYIDPAVLDEREQDADANADKRPADRLESSQLLAWLVEIPGLLFLLDYVVGNEGARHRYLVTYLQFNLFSKCRVISGVPASVFLSGGTWQVVAG